MPERSNGAVSKTEIGRPATSPPVARSPVLRAFPPLPNARRYRRVPAPCNCELGKIEEDFLTRIAMGLDPADEASRGIVEKALRGLHPDAAKDVRGRAIRAGRRRKLLDIVLLGDAIPSLGVFPGLGERWGRLKAEQAAIPIPKHFSKR